MSIFQSLVVGVTGLKAQSNSLSIISDNIANVSTVGYKKNTAYFQTLIGNESTAQYSPGGAINRVRHANHAQGLITGTTSPTDIAISGTGFFPVRSVDATIGDLYYTRAGSFISDSNGDFKNGAGYFLQGWLLTDGVLPTALSGSTVDAATGIASLVPVNVTGITADPAATTAVTVKANLTASETIYAGPPAYDPTNLLANMADSGVSPAFSRSATLVDSLGEIHSVTIGFLKTGINAWAVEIYADTAADLGAASAQIAAGNITFNGDGSLASIDSSLTSAISISWQLPAPATNSVTFAWGTAGIIGVGDTTGLAQFDARYTATITQNGFQAGSLTNISITEDGYVVGTFDNGTTQRLYKIPLGTFVEQDELDNVTGNAFTQTLESGDVTFVQTGTGGAGKIFDSALESSNVETEKELTEMIIAQRAYQSNAKIITTADNMLEEMTQRMLG